MFSTILIILVVLLVLYYLGMIAIDLTKPDTVQKDSIDEEVEIDISEEAADFKPVEVSRKQPTTIIPNQDYQNIEQEEDNYLNAVRVTRDNIDQMMETIGTIPDELRNQSQDGAMRHPVMTDGIAVADLLISVEDLATKGHSDLGDIIYECQNAA